MAILGKQLHYCVFETDNGYDLPIYPTGRTLYSLCVRLYYAMSDRE